MGKIMNSLRIVTCSAVAGLLLASAPGLAQVSADGMGKVVPVELYACNFQEGKNDADLAKVIEQWNKFADDSDMDDYAAWLLTPFFHTTEQDFDIIWLGAFRDGNAMGAGLQNWVANGQEMAAAFAKVVDCGAHVAYSSAMYKAPPGGNAPESGFITMMDCKLNEGQRYTDIKAAELKWADYLAKSGSKVAYYHWMPMFGGGDADFDYKVVSAYPDFKEIGSDVENFANGGGRDVSNEVFGDIDECDDARVYVTRNIRSGKIRD
ncbi:MAG: hypothetical protein AMJ69_07080 [Gammaproteobacteria bacterium SG8_47]|nr:MAG: hypothetical protein AMJ69_07080 [Gammaproteobacteria bacterium SG8_47]